MDNKVALITTSKRKRVKPLVPDIVIDNYAALLSPLVHYRNRGRVRKLAKTYAYFLNAIGKGMGSKTACNTGKQLGNTLKLAALGLPTTYTYPIPIKTDEDNIPVKLKPFRRFLFSKNAVLKGIALSISNMYRTIELDPEASYSEVLDPFSNCESEDHLTGYLNYLANDFVPNYLKVHLDRAREKREISGLQPTVLYSRSPSGESSIDFAHLCALCLMHPRNREYADAVFALYSNFNRDFEVVNLVSLASAMEQSVTDFHTGKIPGEKVKKGTSGPLSLPPVNTWYSRGEAARYAFVPDKGGKTRGITMANYFIQDSLKPIHNDLMYCLSKLKRDFTFKQNKVRTVVNEMFVKRKLGFCFDMTGATNRFPRFPQVLLISTIYGTDVSERWETLMAMEIFHKCNALRFAVGQPMGLYSSFCAFSLCHHALVHYSAKCCGHKGKYGNYMLLGDDIVIFDRKVALMYEWLLTRVLGVKVSKHKSILSSDYMAVEFCKRLFVTHKEISPLGSGVLCPANFDLQGLITILERFYDWSYSGSTTDELIYNYIKTYLIRLFGKRSNLGRRLFPLLCIYLMLTEVTSKGLKRLLRAKLGVSGEDLLILRRHFRADYLERLMKRFEDDRYVVSHMRGQEWSRAVKRSPFGMSHTCRKPIESVIGDLEFYLEVKTSKPPVTYKSKLKLYENIALLDEQLRGMQNSRKRNESADQEFERQRLKKEFRRLNSLVINSFIHWLVPYGVTKAKRDRRLIREDWPHSLLGD